MKGKLSISTRILIIYIVLLSTACHKKTPSANLVITDKKLIDMLIHRSPATTSWAEYRRSIGTFEEVFSIDVQERLSQPGQSPVLEVVTLKDISFDGLEYSALFTQSPDLGEGSSFDYLLRCSKQQVDSLRLAPRGDYDFSKGLAVVARLQAVRRVSYRVECNVAGLGEDAYGDLEVPVAHRFVITGNLVDFIPISDAWSAIDSI